MFDKGLEKSLQKSWLKKVAGKVLVAQGMGPETEVGLAIVTQEKIRQLNLSYLGKDEPTDVLSFGMLPEQSGNNRAVFVTPPDGIQHLGEVIISFPQAVIQAEEHHYGVKREVASLIIHGLLHLLGYDHEERDEEREMRAREAEILSIIEGELK